MAGGTARGKSPLVNWRITDSDCAYFLIPLYSALKFAGLKAFPDIFRQSGFISAMGPSLRLALITTILTLLRRVPTVVSVNRGGVTAR